MVQLRGLSCQPYRLEPKLAESEREVFAVLLLDTRHRLIEYRELFYGSIDRTNVYPREILKAALSANAAALIVAHNHPSGVPEPSMADVRMTEQFGSVLEIVDVRLLDHIVVGGTRTVSFSERGLL